VSGSEFQICEAATGKARPPCKLWYLSLVVSGGVCWWRKTTTKCLWREVSTLRQRQQNGI